ncbi:hypothetical protein Smp_104360 [Schistosoma mansoni]|uniref:hypothetical protein n=1 Tax=Schistosoma mansoni TaxID=6183 RepID=UPI0001A6290B|nr:hypothetical protein Smp_104360 [Schistosoma mansoni]|eukprot:XP_018650249.1 hypothetical protein Smp_104360 [Schistosoma mansoni]
MAQPGTEDNFQNSTKHILFRHLCKISYWELAFIFGINIVGGTVSKVKKASEVQD